MIRYNELTVIGLSLVASILAVLLSSWVLYGAAGLGWLRLIQFIKNDIED